MRIHASTLSVLLEGSTGINTYLRLGAFQDDGENSCNLTVRFDRGEVAKVCGYPQAWHLYDDENYSTARGEADAYPCISRETEVKLLRAVIRGIKAQRKDPMFTDHCSEEYANACIAKCRAAIKALKQPSDAVESEVA